MTNLDNPTTSGFRRGALDVLSGSAIVPCNQFEYDTSDLNVTVYREANYAGYVWGGLYVQLQDTDGNETRCQKDDGSKFYLYSNQRLDLNCSDAPESKSTNV